VSFAPHKRHLALFALAKLPQAHADSGGA